MYIAYASTVSGEHIGSTFLHKDVTAAYNIALDVADLPTGEPGFALWHIWPSWSSPMLEEFILDNGLASPKSGSPIHGQQVYLTDQQITAFTDKYKIKPFRICQHKEEVVFIPPDCPHQVRMTSMLYTCSSCISRSQMRAIVLNTLVTSLPQRS